MLAVHANHCCSCQVLQEHSRVLLFIHLARQAVCVGTRQDMASLHGGVAHVQSHAADYTSALCCCQENISLTNALQDAPRLRSRKPHDKGKSAQGLPSAQTHSHSNICTNLRVILHITCMTTVVAHDRTVLITADTMAHRCCDGAVSLMSPLQDAVSCRLQWQARLPMCTLPQRAAEVENELGWQRGRSPAA